MNGSFARRRQPGPAGPSERRPSRRGRRRRCPGPSGATGRRRARPAPTCRTRTWPSAAPPTTWSSPPGRCTSGSTGCRWAADIDSRSPATRTRGSPWSDADRPTPAVRPTLGSCGRYPRSDAGMAPSRVTRPVRVGRGPHARGRARPGAGPGGRLGAQPHGPVAHHRAAQAAGVPPRAGQRRRRRRRPGGRGRRAWSAGDEVVDQHRPGPRRGARSAGSTRSCDPQMRLLGEHCWGGHGEYCVVAGAPARGEAGRPQLGRGRRPTRSAAPRPGACCAGPGIAEGDTVLVTGIGGGVATFALLLALPHGRPGVRHLPGPPQAGDGGRARRRGRVRLRRALSGHRRHRGRQHRPRHLGALDAHPPPRRAHVRLRRHLRARRSSSTCRACSSSSSTSSAPAAAARRSSATSPTWWPRACRSSSTRSCRSSEYPAALERLRTAEPARQDRPGASAVACVRR